MVDGPDIGCQYFRKDHEDKEFLVRCKSCGETELFLMVAADGGAKIAELFWCGCGKIFDDDGHYWDAMPDNGIRVDMACPLCQAVVWIKSVGFSRIKCVACESEFEERELHRVIDAARCPNCFEDHDDSLVFLHDDMMRCTVCGNEYALGAADEVIVCPACDCEDVYVDLKAGTVTCLGCEMGYDYSEED